MTFTKEQLIEKLQHRISVASGFPGSEKAQMDLELALIALASLEADSVANSGSEAVLFEYTGSGNFYGYGFYRDGVEVDVDITEPLYTAQPAPVSVPDAISTRQAISKMEEYAPCDSINVAFKYGWNACRAAMLQGAAGNSPAIPDGYALVPVEPTMAMLDEFDSIIDHGAEDSKDAWSRLLAASPQQEVKA